MIEKIIIFYLIIAVWLSSYKLIRANKVISDLKYQRDKYYEAWKNGSNIIVREKK